MGKNSKIGIKSKKRNIARTKIISKLVVLSKICKKLQVPAFINVGSSRIISSAASRSKTSEKIH